MAWWAKRNGLSYGQLQSMGVDEAEVEGAYQAEQDKKAKKKKKSSKVATKKKDEQEVGLKAIELYEAGSTDEEISEETKIQVEVIKRWRYRTGRKMNHGSDDGPWLDPKEAEALYNQGKTDVEIARYFGVTRNCVWKWRDRKKLPPNRKR